MITRRPVSSGNTSCSRHSVSPAARRLRQASLNCRNRPSAAPIPAKLRPWQSSRPSPRIAARGLVGGADPQVGLERDHARGEPCQNDGEIGALGLRRLLGLLLVLAGAAQPLGHVVERMHQETHLVVRGERQSRVEVALRDGAGAFHEVLDRLDEALRGEDRAVPGGQQRQQ